MPQIRSLCPFFQSSTSVYVENPTEKMVHCVTKKNLTEWCDAWNVNTHEEDGNNVNLHNSDFLRGIDDLVVETRDDIPSSVVPLEDNYIK